MYCINGIDGSTKRAHQWRLLIFIQHQYISSMSGFLSNGRKETLSLILTKMLLKAILGASLSYWCKRSAFSIIQPPFFQLPRTKCSTLNFLGLLWHWDLSLTFKCPGYKTHSVPLKSCDPVQDCMPAQHYHMKWKVTKAISNFCSYLLCNSKSIELLSS